MNICFTGRRPKDLCGYGQDAYNDFVGSLAAYLVRFVDPAGVQTTQFISGGAQGFDQLAFWAVDLLKSVLPESHRHCVINTVYVPFRGQQRVWKRTGLFSQQEYDAMLQRADRVAYLREELQNTGAIIGALTDRNHMMVDASEQVIALYPDDDWRTSKGGTAECMRYAESAGKPVVQIRYATDDGKLCAVL